MYIEMQELSSAASKELPGGLELEQYNTINGKISQQNGLHWPIQSFMTVSCINMRVKCKLNKQKAEVCIFKYH